MGRYSEKEKLDSLIEVVKLSNSYRDSPVTLLGVLDGDHLIVTTVTIDLDEYGSLFNFIRVWSGFNDPEDHESDIKHEEISIGIISQQEYDFLNDPDNKEMLDDVDEEERFFTWYYEDEVIQHFIDVNYFTTSDELDKMFKDNPIGDHHYTG